MIETETATDQFIKLGGSIDEFRIINESSDLYAVDYQYLLMGRWAFERVMRVSQSVVNDFGSEMSFLTYLAALKKVVHYDIRKPDLEMWGMEYKKGDLTDIPEDDNSLGLVTCLHVAEHIGLGRYGDKLDPDGFKKACKELARVLAPGGTLIFAVPVGKPKVVFNAHRVLSVVEVVKAFDGLKPQEYSAITTGGDFEEKASVRFLENEDYGCGLFRFTK
jgi:SAM-dependent methyltransferase